VRRKRLISRVRALRNGVKSLGHFSRVDEQLSLSRQATPSELAVETHFLQLRRAMHRRSSTALAETQGDDRSAEPSYRHRCNADVTAIQHRQSDVA